MAEDGSDDPTNPPPETPKRDKLTEQASDHYYGLLQRDFRNRPPSRDKVDKRMDHANRPQKRTILGWKDIPEDVDMEAEEWQGDDDESVLHYHE